MFNAYSHMKSKLQKDYNETLHFYNLFNAAIATYEWKNLPDTIRSEFFESLLLTQGTAPVAKIKGEYYTGPGGYCGDVVNFVPTEYQFTNVGVGEFRGKVGDNVSVCWNNATATPDFSLMQISSILTEIDVSEHLNLLFTRFLRIPKVHDNKEKAAVEESIKSIIRGDVTAVVSDNVKEYLMEGAKEGNDFLDLVDIKEVDKLQYLNQYRDNIVKRYFQMHGQGMQSTAKLAQQTNDELHGNDTVSMILPLQGLDFRKRFCDEFNSLNGLNIDVDFSEAWRDSREEAQELYKDGSPDTTPTEKGGDDDAEKDKTEGDI